VSLIWKQKSKAQFIAHLELKTITQSDS